MKELLYGLYLDVRGWVLVRAHRRLRKHYSQRTTIKIGNVIWTEYSRTLAWAQLIYIALLV